MFVLQGGDHMNKLLKDLYDCFYTPPELAATKREIVVLVFMMVFPFME